MSAANDFLAACDKQRQLLGKMRMLWAYHKLHEVDDAENHPGAKEWHSAGNEASENMALLGALAKRAVDAVMQAKYDPAMLFEIAESAGSWERFNQAMRKNLPALKAASVLAGLVEVPKAESTTAQQPADQADTDSDDAEAAALDCLTNPQRKIVAFLLVRKHSTTAATLKAIQGAFRKGELTEDRAVTAAVERINQRWFDCCIPWSIRTQDASDSPRYKLQT